MFHSEVDPKSQFVVRLEVSPLSSYFRQTAALIYWTLLLTFGQAPWLSRWRIPQRSWSPPSYHPVPGCEARRWLFHLGCRPQSGAEPDASRTHVTISQHPATDRIETKIMMVGSNIAQAFRKHSILSNIKIADVATVKQKHTQSKTDQNSLRCDAVCQSTWHSHFNSSFCQRFSKQIHLQRDHIHQSQKVHKARVVLSLYYCKISVLNI